MHPITKETMILESQEREPLSQGTISSVGEQQKSVPVQTMTPSNDIDQLSKDLPETELNQKEGASFNAMASKGVMVAHQISTCS